MNHYWLIIWVLWLKQLWQKITLWYFVPFLWNLEQDLKSILHHPDKILESGIIFYIQFVQKVVSMLNSITEQALRQKMFCIFWAFLSSHKQYLSCTYSRCNWLDWLDMPSRRGHKTLCADTVRRCGLSFRNKECNQFLLLLTNPSAFINITITTLQKFLSFTVRWWAYSYLLSFLCFCSSFSGWLPGPMSCSCLDVPNSLCTENIKPLTWWMNGVIFSYT